MKQTRTIFSLLLFILSFTAFSQKHALGIRGGVNLCRPTSFENKGTMAAFPGFDVGLIYRYQLNKKFSVQIEPAFSQKVFTDKGVYFRDYSGKNLSHSDMHYVFNYVAVPLIFNYYFISKEKFSVAANTGLVTNYSISGKRLSADGVRDDTFNTYLKDFMFELPVGLELSFRLKESWWLDVSPRVNIGLSNLGKDDTFLKTKLNSLNLFLAVKKTF